MATLFLTVRTHSWSVVGNTYICTGTYSGHVHGDSTAYVFRHGDERAKLTGKYQAEVDLANVTTDPVCDMAISERTWLRTCVEESVKVDNV